MSNPRIQRFDRRITEGHLPAVVWHLAWPTMLQNIIGGVQGIVDHAMVGHFVGYRGNAAIGVSWQIFLVVIVFISSLYTGMAVLVARFAGASEPEKVDRVVYQAFLATVFLALGIMAPLGYLVTPWLLDLVHASPEVRVEALPYLRIMFAGSAGMLLFFMLGGALRAAGDTRTPLRLGILLTLFHMVLNVALIVGVGPIPALGVRGAALGTSIAGTMIGAIGIGLLFSGRMPIHFSRHMQWRPDWEILRSLLRFGLPSGFQGVAMNIGGVLLLRFIGSLPDSAEAQAAYTVGYNMLFSLVTWTSVGLMGAAATIAGQNLGARRPDRARHAVAVTARLGLMLAAGIGLAFLFVPEALLGVFGMNDARVLEIGVSLLRVLAISGLFIAVALVYTGGLQGTGDTRSPFFISLISQIGVPLGLCLALQTIHGGLRPIEIWIAILLGHLTRCLLSVVRFRQGRWRNIHVDIEPAQAR
jgi:putative MATE family efflux protein